MPATRSRSSTAQTAEVAAEEVKQVQEQDGSDIVAPPVVQSEPESVAQAESVDAPAAEEPAVAVTDVAATNGSAEPAVAAVAAETNGSAAESAPVAESNGVAAEQDAVVADVAAGAVDAETVAVDGKRKSEVGDGDSVPDSTEAKKQKVADAATDEPVVDATA